MNAVEETKMIRGAFWACALPVGLGVFGLTFTLIFDPSFRTGRSFSDSMHFFTFPVVLCFIFGTPLAAWLAYFRLKRVFNLEKRESWESAVGAALHSASSVHFWAALIYTIISLMFFSPKEVLFVQFLFLLCRR